MIPTFVQSITNIMRRDKKVIVITADMGFSVFEEVQKEFGERFMNTGVTEQASMSIAAGMALSGHTVFFYAQSAFATMRCFEQVRLDVAYNRANVKIIGSAAGFSLNQLGVSHFATEDIGLMRLLPGMTILVPGDPLEAKWAVEKAHATEGPVFIRFTRNGSTVFHKHPLSLDVGKGIVMKRGSDCAVFVSGGLLYLAHEVADLLKKKGVSCKIISMPTIKPLDTSLILREAKHQSAIFTLEEHGIVGGLGSAVAEVLADHALGTTFYRFGLPDAFVGVTGSIPYLLSTCGLSKEKIGAKIVSVLNG